MHPTLHILKRKVIPVTRRHVLRQYNHYLFPLSIMSLLSPSAVDAKSLHVLLDHELKDLYDGEHQIIDTLPEMIEQATNPDLKRALSDHLKETELQVTRLEDAFNILQTKPERVTCDGMKGIIKEGQHVLKGDMDPAVKDDAIIAAAQRVEHYEMAGYGSARDHAKHLGFYDIAQLLDTTLNEEGKADQLLSRIAGAMHKEMAKA